jgi:hypothetical protein
MRARGQQRRPRPGGGRGGTTGASVWLPQEADLDAVTALSGSGPAYVFYFLEAMRRAGTEMGLDAETATPWRWAPSPGLRPWPQASSDPPEVLRERVTSKGGTTYAALTSMEDSGVADAFVRPCTRRGNGPANWATNSAAEVSAASGFVPAQPQGVLQSQTGKQGEAQPVVEPERAKTALAGAVADHAVVPHHLRQRQRQRQSRTTPRPPRGHSSRPTGPGAGR